MAENAPEKRLRLKQNVSVAVVLMLAAAMFSVSAKLNAGQSRHPEDLSSLVRVETTRNQELETSNALLQARVDAFTDESDKKNARLSRKVETATGVASGITPVKGPGMRIALSDAPAGQELLEGLTVDDLVVHQQDLQAVINALWAGGAEAMTLQGQRVTPLTAFRCVGNVLLLHGQVYSPPYVVEAIGDPNSLKAALDSSESIEIYKQYVAAVGLGWESDSIKELQLPAANNANALKYAHLPKSVNIWD